MAYLINVNKFYKIWFSKNPAQALGIENELALVRLRDKHPGAIISLVYSSACLNPEAQLALETFCHHHHIDLFDFDNQLEDAIANAVIDGAYNLSDDKDKIKIALQNKALYQLAKEEITNTLTHQGGNLAAASDITRLLEPIIALGIYSDLDVELNFRELILSASIECDSAILIQSEGKSISMNNEFFAIAKTRSNTIDPDAQARLRKIKEVILEKNTIPYEALLTPFIKGMPSDIQHIMLLKPVSYFFSIYPKASIFAFREYVQQLTLSQIFALLPAGISESILKQPYSNTLTEENLYALFGHHLNIKQTESKADEMTNTMSDVQAGQQQFLSYKRILYNHSVTHITGPAILKHLINNINTYQAPLTEDQIKIISTELDRYSVAHSPLKGCVFSTNTHAATQKNTQENAPKNKASLFGHQSWSPLGAQKKEARENSMEQAAKIIKTAWIKKTKKPKK